MTVFPILILSLMLLAEAMISRFLTGSALHLTLVLGAGIIQGGALFFGRPVARLTGLGLAIGVGMGGWQLFESGLVPISLSELPGLFHLALAIHFLIWALNLKQPGRVRPDRSAPAQAPEPIGLIAAIFAALVIVWTAGTIEIYGTSALLVRSLGFAVLAGSVMLCFRFHKPDRANAVSISSSERAGNWKTGALILAIASAAVVASAALVSPARQLAGKLYNWYGIDDDTTRLEEFGADREALRSGSGPSDGAGRELPRKADIQLDPSPRFFLGVDDAESFEKLTRQRIYIRTSTLSVFENDGKLAPLRSGEWRYDSDDGKEDGQVLLTGGIPDSSNAVTYSMMIEKRDSRAIPMIARTQSVGLESIYSFADDWYQLALEEHQERVRFQATAAQRSVSGLLETGVSLKSGNAPRDYLQLPAGPVTGEIRRIAAGLLQDSDRSLDTLLPRVRDWLKQRCSYSLRYDNPDNRPPIENFLLGERKGHCELFASSTVMLLRSLGIPARVAYGFCGGAKDSGRRLLAFRESDFHAWAEVYLANHGWIVFETTPPGDGAVQFPRVQPGGAAFAGLDLAAFEDIGIMGPFESVSPSLFSEVIGWITEFAADWFFAICAGIVALGFLGIWLRSRRNRTGTHSGNGTDRSSGRSGKSRRLPVFLTEYLAACAELGYPKRPGQTLKELLAALRKAGLCNGEFDQLTRYAYLIRYVDSDRNSSLEGKFRETVREFRAAAKSR